ncbi:MAG TPA: c-type cytochrome biogenesis protein CcmI [Leucothrix mucor]|nr:c-type cytochrome biogenesis protein CcmI [Leucothrix mucor]
MFWIFAVLLIVLALAIILPTLLKKTTVEEEEEDDRRNQNIQIAKDQLLELETSLSNKDVEQAEYEARRDELEQALHVDIDSEDVTKVEYAKPTFITAGIVALMIPLIAVGMYAKYGDSKAADPETAKVASKVPMTAEGKPDVDAMVLGLRKKLDAEPNNPKGWYMMGRSYMALKRYKGAVESYEKLLELKPNDAKVMLFLADADAMAQGGNMSGRPTTLIEKSLEIEPNSITGLWLGGMISQQQGKHTLAIKRWTALIPLLGDDAAQVAEVKAMMATSQKELSPEALAAIPKVAAPIAPKAPKAPVASMEKIPPAKVASQTDVKQSIVVTVSLSEELKSQANPTDTVFIYAKAMTGPPMPLAAKRLQVKDLPVTITLDDSTAMMPTMKLSAFPNIKIGARVSKSGNAIGVNGDLYTEKSSVKKGTKQTLVIDSILKK